MFVYLHGFASSPGSRKAQHFWEKFAQEGLGLEIPALDEGDFFHLTLTRQLDVVARTCRGKKPLVLIGSSMGGYLATLFAREHPVDALILMAPAVDFARRWEERLGPETLARWERENALPVYHYAHQREMPLSFALMQDARLHEPWPRVSAPTLVFHGRQDDVVPQARVERWVSLNPSARLVLFEEGHELSGCMEEMTEESLRFLAKIPSVAAAYPTLEKWLG